MNARNNNIEKEIEDLDREAREALDKLADKREELEKQHRATELAEERKREREAVERERREEERRRKALAEARRRADEIGAKRRRLEERAEAEIAAFTGTLRELLDLDPTHHKALREAERSVRSQELFSRTLLVWTIGRLNPVLEGIGHDYLDGKPLPERDPLTPDEANEREARG